MCSCVQGALTHGDRRTADSRDLSSFNIDNEYGKNALQRTMGFLMCSDGRDLTVPLPPYNGDFFTDVKPALVGCGLAMKDSRGSYGLEKDSNNITKFLNRILGMPVDLQNAIFQYFSDTLNAITTQAKKAGRFDKGILDLCVGADGCNSELIREWNCVHSTGKATTSLHRLQVKRGLSWQNAIEKAHMLFKEGEGFYLCKRLRRSRQAALLAVMDPSKANEKRTRFDKLYSIYKPNLGLVSKLERFSELRKKYELTNQDDVKDHWDEQYTCFATTCAHVFWSGECEKTKSGSKCENGLRFRTYHVLCGSVLNVWSEVEQVLASNTHAPSHRLQVVRFKTTDKLRHVGES